MAPIGKQHYTDGHSNGVYTRSVVGQGVGGRRSTGL